jgi:hypothetical protein
MMTMLIVSTAACARNSKNFGITLDFTLAGGDEGGEPKPPAAQ